MENADNTEFHGGNVRSDRELQYDELMRVTGHPKDLVSFVSKLMPMNTNDPRNLPEMPFNFKLNGPIETATAPLLPTEENLGFKFDLNDPHVDISSASSELASSFALWFGDDVRNWHPEEIADAALRFGIASGGLKVRKTVRWEFGSGASATCECGYIALKEHDGNSNFCPCCGSNVIEG